MAENNLEAAGANNSGRLAESQNLHFEGPQNVPELLCQPCLASYLSDLPKTRERLPPRAAVRAAPPPGA